MVPSRAAVGMGRVLASVEEVWASAFGPWSSILSVQSVLYGLLAATLGAILFMELGKKLRVPLGHLAFPILGNWLQDQRKMNDHVYELYKPKGDVEPAMEILFFHGLQFGPSRHAYLSTWTSPGDRSTGEQVWPGTWLAEEFPNARILSMSYDSSMRRTPEQGRSDLFNVAENLIHAICLADIGQEFRRPVILVGHSFGGLVIKKLCIEADRIHSLRPDLKTNQMIKEFLHNIGGVFFYGTPHHGSALGSMASRVLDGPLLAYVKRLDTDSARLHKDFCDVCINYKIWRIAGVGELRATRRGLFRDVVVPEASARYGEFSTVQEDHISLCKPAAKTSTNFQLLTTFVRSIVPKEEAYFENRQPTPKAAVGLDLLVEDVQGMLQENSRLGMVGMGGVGKTTLAMAVFNKLGAAFEYSCFVPEVKLIARRVEGTSMTKELWKRVHRRGKVVADPDKENWSQLKGKKLLLVLDDVAEDRDLKILSDISLLLDIKEDVDSGSRFIVTSRNRVLLTSFQDDICVYPVQGLTQTNAKKLFMSYAFPNQAVLPVAFESLVNGIVKKCDGLPLTLEVLGNYLKRSKEDKIWEQTLEALDKADNVAGLEDRLWAKLRLSYTGLSTEEQQMFLDATTFFSDNDWTLREAKAAWGVAYQYADLRWRSLVDMSLVYDGNQDERIKVHEQLQSLGKKIASDANQDGKCMRVWKAGEGLKMLQSTDTLANNQDFHSLRLEAPKEGQLTIPRSCFRRFKKLQYLDLYPRDWGRFSETSLEPRLTIDGAEENATVPAALVLLQWPDLQFGQVFLDPALLPHLAVLKLYDYDLEDLPDSIGHLSALKIFHMRARNLRILPDEFGHLSQLEWLELDCGRLQSLPETFGDLSNLKHLKFDGFRGDHSDHLEICPTGIEPVNLPNTLPNSFGQLSKLQYLAFHICLNLRSLPNSFGRLSKLQYLKFYSCRNLQSLPESFEGLSSLQHLHVENCWNLNVLPESFGRLPALKRLKFNQCNRLECLPESFGQLPVLEHLELTTCRKLQSLPESFGQLTTLRYLNFSVVSALQSLPESFGRLPVLEHLDLYDCPKLQSLPECFGDLTTLRHLKAYISNLRSLPESFGRLSELKYLEFRDCTNLQSLPESFGRLSELEYLRFHSCTSMQSLPGSMGKLSNLRLLAFHCCDNLPTLPDCQFPNLEKLIITHCRKIESLPFSTGQLKALHNLEITYTAIRKFPDWIKSLPLLQILVIGGLPYLDRWPRWVDADSLDPAITLLEFFRTQDGQFGLKDTSAPTWMRFFVDKLLRANALDKFTVEDYGGALADLQRALGVIGLDDLRQRAFLLQEMGIVKRYAGDLDGALEDLTLALNWYNDADYEAECYNCSKHRGYVKYLSGDEEGAREDGKEALRHLLQSDIEEDLDSLGLGDESVSYLEFEYTGYEEMMELTDTSSFLSVMEKVRASDFDGALAELEARSTLRETDSFFLQERGICKRLVGDLVGSLKDLTSALELNWEEEGQDDYECRKHRGFVKYLLEDFDGAREDANKAMASGCGTDAETDEWSDEWEVGHRECLGADPIKFLEFKLK